GVGRIVVDLLRRHGPNDADIVDDTADSGKEAAEHFAVFAETLKGMLRRKAEELFALQLRNLLPFGERFRHGLAVQLHQRRFVVEGLEVRGSAGLIEKNDALRLRR